MIWLWLSNEKSLQTVLSTFILIGFNPDIRPDRSTTPCSCQLHLMDPLPRGTACLLPVHPPCQRVRTHSFPWTDSNTKGGEILSQLELLPTPSSLPSLSLCYKTNWKGDVGITITGRGFVTAWPQSYGAPRWEGKGSCRKRCWDQDPAPLATGLSGLQEMYFACDHFKEPLYSTGCRMFAFTEDLKDLHLGKPTVHGSALQHSSQHTPQHLSVTQGTVASLSLEWGKISAPPHRKEGLLWITRCLPTVATS